MSASIAITNACVCARHVQLEYALLLYFAGQHDAAVRQLLTYKEDYFDEPGWLLEGKRTDDASQQEHEQLSILITRSKLHCANMALYLRLL